MTTIRVDISGIDGVHGALDAYPRQARWALRSSINKTLGWVRTHGLRAISQEHDVPLKVLRSKTIRSRRRVALRPATSADLSGIAWFGLAPINASYLGTPRQTMAGAHVRGHNFPGAFVSTMPSGHLGIFKRKSKSRLPLKEQTVSLATSASALRSIARQVPPRLSATLAQNFNYAVNVRGRAA